MAFDLSPVKALLQCTGCDTREVIELSSSAQNGHWRRCERCGKVTRWSQAMHEAPSYRSHRMEDASAPSVVSKPADVPVAERKRAERRVSRRLEPKKMTACIPPPDGFGQDDIVEVLDVSRGGARFLSLKRYIAGQWVRVAVPYTPGAINIFSDARIVWSTSAEDGWTEYGLAYVKKT